MSRQILIITSGVLVLFIATCSSSTEPQPGDKQKDDPEVTQAELAAAETTLVAATQEFGFELFRAIAEDAEPTENVFISPLSVLYALTMASNGAVGDTKAAFNSVLGVEGHRDEALNQMMREITEKLSETDPDVQFSAANSIWSRLGKKLVPEFVSLCQDNLDAIAREMDFQAPGAADTINNWVSANTSDKIKEMIQPPISPELVLLLLNAIYFKANWTYPFDTARVRTAPFYLADGTTKDCELMGRSYDEDAVFFYPEFRERPIFFFGDNEYYHGEPRTIKGASLPYGSEGFYMTLLMAGTESDMDELLSRLDAENWQTWLELRREQAWRFAMPKFRFEYDVSMTDVLAGMGLDIAFDPGRADFSDMFVDGVGWIDYVKHKTFVQVDEHGTEAAAVTQVGYADSIPPAFSADHPFIVVIHEESTGVILFIGRISDPVWED